MNLLLVGFGFFVFLGSVLFSEYMENPALFRGWFAGFASGPVLFDDETDLLNGRMVKYETEWGVGKWFPIVRSGAKRDYIYAKIPTGKFNDYKEVPVFGLTPENFVFADPLHPDTSDFIILGERLNPFGEVNLPNWILTERTKALGQAVPTSEDDKLGFLQGAKLSERLAAAQRINKRGDN